MPEEFSDARKSRFYIMDIASLSLLVLAAALSPAVARAASTEEVIVTGTRIADVPAVVTTPVEVVTRDEIDAGSFATTLEVLRSVPGLHVSQPGGQGGVSSIFIRGSEANFVLVFIDGVKVNDPTNTRGGSFDFANLNIDDVERIEIVRGPQSAIYGSDALGGVISIITRRYSSGPRMKAAGSLGDTGYRSGALQAGAHIIGGGTGTFRATTRNDGGSVPGSQFRSESLSTRGDWLTKHGSVGMHATFTSSAGEAYPQDSGGPELAEVREVDEKSGRQLGLGTFFNARVSDQWSLKIFGSHFHQTESTASPGILPGVRTGVPRNASTSHLTRENVTAFVNFSGRGAIKATFGVSFEREDGDARGLLELSPGTTLETDYSINRKSIGVFSEARWAAGDGNIVSASLRSDIFTGKSKETTGALGVLLPLGEKGPDLRASWGAGFKQPSFFALANPLVGNPDLRPERSRGMEAGMVQSFNDSRLLLELTWFNNRFYDLIDFDAESFTNVNRDKIVMQGVEFQISDTISEYLSLSAHATYVDIDLERPEARLRQRPAWRGGASLNWRVLKLWNLQASWLRVGKTFDSSIPTGQRVLAGYDQVNLVANRKMAHGLRLSFSASNLLDSEYQEAIGFTNRGRHFRFSVNRDFDL